MLYSDIANIPTTTQTQHIHFPQNFRTYLLKLKIEYTDNNKFCIGKLTVLSDKR